MMTTNQGWKGIPDKYLSSFSQLFTSNEEGLNLSNPCPICGKKTLHKYYHAITPLKKIISGQKFVAQGGLWEWCSSCRHYDHLSALVPEWWHCFMDTYLEVSKLTAEPEELENVLQRLQKKELDRVSSLLESPIFSHPQPLVSQRKKSYPLPIAH